MNSPPPGVAVYKVVPADPYGAPSYFSLVAGPYLPANGKAATALANNAAADPASTYFVAPYTKIEGNSPETSGQPGGLTIAIAHPKAA